MDQWSGPVERNLTSTMLCMQAEAIAMIRDGVQGRSVNFGSTSGTTVGPSVSHLGAANAGVIHLTKSAALEPAPCGVDVLERVRTRTPAMARGGLNMDLPGLRISEPRDVAMRGLSREKQWPQQGELLFESRASARKLLPPPSA